MKGLLNFLKQIITAGSGISSKRVCGLLGWLTLLGCLIYATSQEAELPSVTPEFIFGTIVLLGVDSVTSIWKRGGTPPGTSEYPPVTNHGPGPKPDTGIPHPKHLMENLEGALKGEEEGTVPTTVTDSDDTPEPGSLNNAQL